MQKYATNLVKLVTKNGGDILKSDTALKGMVALVKELGVKGITVQGLEVKPEDLQAAIDQEKQASGNATQQVGQMTDDQVMALVNGMDRRALKAAIQADPALAKQLVSGMGANGAAPAGGRRPPQQATAQPEAQPVAAG